MKHYPVRPVQYICLDGRTGWVLYWSTLLVVDVLPGTPHKLVQGTVVL